MISMVCRVTGESGEEAADQWGRDRELPNQQSDYVGRNTKSTTVQFLSVYYSTYDIDMTVTELNL